MGGASAFIWVMVVILGLAWALTQTGTVNLGVNFNLWVNLLLVLAVLGAVFNLPMSTVTLLEDGVMAAMAAVTLVTMLLRS